MRECFFYLIGENVPLRRSHEPTERAEIEVGHGVDNLLNSTEIHSFASDVQQVRSLDQLRHDIPHNDLLDFRDAAPGTRRCKQKILVNLSKARAPKLEYRPA